MRTESVYDKYDDIVLSISFEGQDAYDVWFIAGKLEEAKRVFVITLDSNGDWHCAFDEESKSVFPTAKEIYEARKAVKDMLYEKYFKMNLALELTAYKED